jgi:hypothetical protein
MVRALVQAQLDLLRQQQGLVLLHFSEDGAHLVPWRKNQSGEVKVKGEKK